MNFSDIKVKTVTAVSIGSAGMLIAALVLPLLTQSFSYVREASAAEPTVSNETGSEIDIKEISPRPSSDITVTDGQFVVIQNVTMNELDLSLFEIGADDGSMALSGMLAAGTEYKLCVGSSASGCDETLTFVLGTQDDEVIITKEGAAHASYAYEFDSPIPGIPIDTEGDRAHELSLFSAVPVPDTAQAGEMITIQNTGNLAANLEGYYFEDEGGNTLFTFPAGAVASIDGKVTVCDENSKATGNVACFSNGETSLNLDDPTDTIYFFEPGGDLVDDACYENPAEGDEVDLTTSVCDDGDEEPDPTPTGMIISPEADEVVSGLITLEATYDDGDEDDDDAVQWAVRKDSCEANPANNVAGNVGTFNDPYNFDGQTFTAPFDTTLHDDGLYCFIFNPTDDGEVDVRETQLFTINNSEEEGGGGGSPIPRSSVNSDDGGSVAGVSVSSSDLEPEGRVLGATTCSPYLTQFFHAQSPNSAVEVIKLQLFLNIFAGESLDLTGIYDTATIAAVERYQTANGAAILLPWVEAGYLNNMFTPTGYVYLTTRRHINQTMCSVLNISLPPLVPDTDVTDNA